MPTGNKKGQPPKYRNVTVDTDVVEILNAKAAELEKQFGFKPTVSQTLRHLIKGASK